MRVTVYNTDRVVATVYFDVEAIVFDRQNNVRLTFFTGETKNLTPADYTDIDCKKGAVTWKDRF